MSAITATVSPVRCTPWCREGTGHGDAEEPEDQCCHGAGHRIELRPPRHGSGRSRAHLVVQLYRDVHQADGSDRAILEPPHIEVYPSCTDVLELSIGEARALGELLLELADVARPRLRPWYLRGRDRRSTWRRSSLDRRQASTAS
jgi:hypothetical protein